MAEGSFPALHLADWRPTRDTIHTYSRVLGDIRRALSPYQKNSWHGGLHVTAAGLTTTPIPGGGFTFEMALDCTDHQAVVTTSRGEAWREGLIGQSPARFCQTILDHLQGLGVKAEIDRAPFADDQIGVYDPSAVERFWQVLPQIDMTLKRFKGEQRGETGPVVLWPHGFDIALLWFSGRLIPGQDPKRASRSDEQMNFGFSPGTDDIGDAYFYVTAYPAPEGFIGLPLPADASWHTATWRGALLRYEALVGVADPAGKLLDFFRAAHKLGSERMK
jgi:Family of unknown function (DUF5996)